MSQISLRERRRGHFDNLARHMDHYIRAHEWQVYPYLHPQQVPKMYSLTFVGDSVLWKSATWICNLGRDICSDGGHQPVRHVNHCPSCYGFSLWKTSDECEVHTVIGLLFLMLPELMFTRGIYLFNYNIALRMRAFSIMQREFCPVLWS